MGWGAGRFSVHIARSDFSPEWRRTGYWICQAWTLWQRNELHKVSWGWAQFAALILICLQHWEICTTYWTNNKRGESGEKPPVWPRLFWWCLSLRASGSCRLSRGLVPYAVRHNEPCHCVHTLLGSCRNVLLLFVVYPGIFTGLQGSAHPKTRTWWVLMEVNELFLENIDQIWIQVKGKVKVIAPWW